MGSTTAKASYSLMVITQQNMQLLTRQLVDEKFVASCQQTCCKRIFETCYPQACCKLFQQVVASLQKPSCNKPDFNKLVAT